MQLFFLKKKQQKRFTLQSHTRLQGLASRPLRLIEASRQATASRSGFTLIEVLVSVTIIAVLVAIAAISYSSINKQSHDARRKSDIEQIRSALEMYRADNGTYPGPSAWANAWAPVDNTALIAYLEPYLSPLPRDPVGNAPYYYYFATGCSGADPARVCYRYCLLSFVEKPANSVTECDAGKPGIPMYPNRTPSFNKNP